MSKKAKVIRIVLIAILSIAFILYIALPAGIGIFASIHISGKPGEAPDGFESVSFKTDENISIAGWYKAPENGAVILVIHGSNGSRESMRPYIAMLSDAGYGVLAIDLSGHGESAGAANALGWKRESDIKASLEFLQGKGITSVGGLGISLGGEELLSVCSTFPEIKAIVSDGATHSTLADYLVLPSRQSIFRSWTTRVMYFFAQLCTGQTPPETTMLDSIAKTVDTRFLLVAAKDTEEEIEYNTAFAQAAGERAELWSVPKAGHTEAMGLYPEEYKTRVLGFFNSVLLP